MDKVYKKKNRTGGFQDGVKEKPVEGGLHVVRVDRKRRLNDAIRD